GRQPRLERVPHVPFENDWPPRRAREPGASDGTCGENRRRRDRLRKAPTHGFDHQLTTNGVAVVVRVPALAVSWQACRLCLSGSGSSSTPAASAGCGWAASTATV